MNVHASPIALAVRAPDPEVQWWRTAVGEEELAKITESIRAERISGGVVTRQLEEAIGAALGVPYVYFENTEGGHSNDADPVMTARRWALHYVFLAQQLME